ncbi:MAG: hypothetical protein GY856_11185 [bacterium]|nr:hypothetical protein [bacterium]
MARPALIIGLGGTGQWVLTYVKKELLDYTQGEGIPPEVRLVAFDTARSITAAERKPKDEEPVVIDGVRLDLGEFYHLKGNIESIVREIATENRHPHIGSWLQARTLLNRLGPGQFILEEGAGQMRPFGRLAVFKDLEANPETSTIFGTIRDAIDAIRETVREGRSLEISIVASLAGGTGAGMAIDVAHIARTVAEEAIGDKFVIRGFFVLPRAFHRIPGGDNADMRARSFAAIRELSRFLTVFGDRRYPMVYNREPAFAPDLQKDVEKRLFELCYLIDAKRERNNLEGVEAKYGVFPSIADAILAFVDESSGQVYTEHVHNVTRRLVRPDDDRAYFSSLGTYAVTLPIRDVAEESSCKLAIDFLRKLVRPELNDEGRPIRLAHAENAEMAGKRGADLADDFLRNPGAVEGIRGSLFLREVAKAIEVGHARNDALLEQATNRGNLEWLQVIEPDEVTDELRELRLEIRKILEHSLRDDVKTAREKKIRPAHDVERVEREVAKYRTEYLGREHADGTMTGGKFREALARYEEVQTGQFRRGLAGYGVNRLNGASQADPLAARGAKLGFVLDFLDTVATRFDTYAQFLAKIRERRARQGRLQLQREQVQAARSRMLEDRHRAGWLRKAGFHSQEEYLELMEQLIELEKDQLVFDTVCRIADRLRNHGIALRDVVRGWAEVLVLGSAEEDSLYQALLDARELIRARRERTRFLDRVRKEETSEEYEQDLYDRFANEHLKAMLSGAEWQLVDDGEDLALSVSGTPLMRRKLRQRDRPTTYNTRLLLEQTREAFQKLVSGETISKRLMDLHDEEKLSKEFFNNCCPLFGLRSEPPEGQRANFLAVACGDVEGGERYFQKVVRQLRQQGGDRAADAQLVRSQGTNKCTLIYTIDVVNPDCMSVYEELYTAYRDFTDDRRLLHNFPAEVNAVHYEQRLQRELQRPYRTFTPRIVFMLEHDDWVRNFVRCLTFKLIVIRKDEDHNPFYVLDLPECEHRGRSFSAQVVELTEHATRGKPDLLRAMDTFIFRQKDFRRHLEIPIDANHITAALVATQRQLGDETAVIKAVEEFIAGQLIRGFKVSEARYEQDLGDLFHLILQDEIDRLAIIPIT